MKKRLLFTVTGLLLAATTMMAVPVKPGLKKTVTLSDGTTVELTLKGDEHYSYYVDADNNPCQVVNGKLVRMSREEVTQTWTELKKEHMGYMNTPSGQTAGRRAGTPINKTTGVQRGLVILLQYPDKQFMVDNVLQTYKDFFNKEGFNMSGMSGSVRDYFKAQSYGQLEIDFDVVGPYTTKQKQAYYGQHYTDEQGRIEHDAHPALMVAEAVDAAAKEVNFRNYDWDDNGEVDQVFVVFAGYAESSGGGDNCIWPHKWALSAEDVTRKYNGVTIDNYACSSELSGNTGTIIGGIGTACHEFSHCLGLPDMYDTSGNEPRNFGMGMWDIMCSGNYNDDSRTPAGFTAYERWFSRWMEPVELKTLTYVNDMAPLAEKAEAYILYNEKNKNEYYILENRQPVGFDAGLYGHGLLVVHVDYDEDAWKRNTVNNIQNHERMTIIPADGQKALTKSSLAGDPYPGSTGNISLTNYSIPAAELYNDNKDKRKLMSKPIDNIRENTAAHTVSFVACHPELATPEMYDTQALPSGNGFLATWSAVSGAFGYELELTAIDVAPSTPEEALLQEYEFNECYSPTASYTDIGSKLSSYGLAGWRGSKLYTTPQKLRMGTTTVSGTLKSPTWKVPSSHNITIVMGADKEKNDVEGAISISYGNEGDPIADCPSQAHEIHVTGYGKHVFNFLNVNKDLYWIDIKPDVQMYLNYLAIYNGLWTAEQLGINDASEANAQQASRRSIVVDNYTTNTNSYTFDNLEHLKRYVVRARALGEDNTVSDWSNEKIFEFTTGILAIDNDAVRSQDGVRYFDLQGREVSSETKGLLIMKQGNCVKKVFR